MNEQLRYLVAAEDRASAVFRRLRGEIEGAGKATAGLRSIVGPLGPQLAGVFTVAAVGAWVNRTVEGVDALNDLADATGDTVENLSALEDVALRTGTSLDTAGDAVIKLNKAIGDAAKDPDSAAGQAIRNLGLNVKELLALSPVERLQAVGRVLNSFDGENKLFYNITLLGKGARETAPLLKDLAEAGKLQATVTTQQAEEAEKLRKEWAALSKEGLDLSRTLALPLVSSINETIELFRKGRKEGKGFFEILRQEQLRQIGLGDQPDAAAAKSAFLRGDKDTTPIKGKLPALGDDSGGKKRKEEISEAQQALASYVQGLSRAIEAERGLTAEQQAQTFLKSLGVTGEIDQVRELVLGLAAERDMREEIAGLAKLEANARAALIAQQIADQDELNRLLATTPTGKEKARLDTVLKINRAFDEGRITLQQWVELTEQLDDNLEDVKETGKSVGDELGLVFVSAAGQAITEWQGFRNLLKGILQDLAQIVLRRTVLEPAGKALGDIIDGIDWGSIIGSLFASAKGNAFDSHGVMAFARGGVVDRPTLFNYGASRRMGVMGEAGAEAILPLERGADGRLGVRSGGGGGGVQVVINVGAGAGVDDWRRSARQIGAELQRNLRRTGAIV